MLVQHFLENSAARSPDKVALICDGKRLTYSEIDQQADRLASALISLGVKRQDRVVIFMDNSAESVIALFGILKAGAIFIMVNATMKAKKLNYILKDSGACAMITHANKARVINEALDGAAELRHVLWAGAVPSAIPSSQVSMHSWNDVLSVVGGRWSAVGGRRLAVGGRRSAVGGRWSAVGGWRSAVGGRRLAVGGRWSAVGIDVDLATIIYTSGSTGEPKGVMSTHKNVTAVVQSITTFMKNTPEDIVLNVLPLSFDYGLYQALMTVAFGGTLVLEKGFGYSRTVAERFKQEQVTGFPIVPTIAVLLLKMNGFLKTHFESVRYISSTGDVFPVPVIRELRALLPHVEIFSMYGLTECKRVSYLPPDQLDKRPDSVGIPIPNTEVFVVDENGNEVPPGRVGELVIRGSNVMQGYWNAPEETAKRYRPGRYRGEALLYSGDLFKRDEEGYLYFVARKDDMIKTKGERVSPKEIENALCEMEGVAEAAVIGVPDEILGHAVKAVVIREKGSAIKEQDVVRFCSENLEPFMVPKHVEFVDSFPKTSNGKIDKKQIK